MTHFERKSLKGTGYVPLFGRNGIGNAASAEVFSPFCKKAPCCGRLVFATWQRSFAKSRMLLRQSGIRDIGGIQRKRVSAWRSACCILLPFGSFFVFISFVLIGGGHVCRRSLLAGSSGAGGSRDNHGSADRYKHL